jgi:hypothetical protein
MRLPVMSLRSIVRRRSIPRRTVRADVDAAGAVAAMNAIIDARPDLRLPFGGAGVQSGGVRPLRSSSRAINVARRASPYELH